MKGYRTYISAGVIILHQIGKTLGFDVPDETVSTLIDTLAGIAAVYFRSKA